MVFFGILAGLGAAGFQSAGYIFSRIYIKRGGTPLDLALRAQIIIGIFSIPLLALVWQDGFWGDWSWGVPLLLTAIGATGGELMFFRSEHSIGPSRLSSLLGLRVAVLMVVSAILHLEQYDGLQVCGALLAVLSAGVMNYQNKAFRWAGMQFVGAALAFYAMSDLSIKFMIDRIDSDALWHRALLAVCMLNLFLGIILLPAYWWRQAYLRENRKGETLSGGFFATMKPATPYAASWFVKQLFLYFCYAAVGPVFGNVIMSARGPLSIVLVMILLHFGVKNLEKNKTGADWLQRIAATLLMVLAIVLYSLG